MCIPLIRLSRISLHCTKHLPMCFCQHITHIYTHTHRQDIYGQTYFTIKAALLSACFLQYRPNSWQPRFKISYMKNSLSMSLILVLRSKGFLLVVFNFIFLYLGCQRKNKNGNVQPLYRAHTWMSCVHFIVYCDLTSFVLTFPEMHTDEIHAAYR